MIAYFTPYSKINISWGECGVQYICSYILNKNRKMRKIHNKIALRNIKYILQD